VCGNHPSDWEGLTVILARCTRAAAGCTAFDRHTSYHAVGIRYGQHEGDAPFVWSDLQKRWDELVERVPSAPWSRLARGNRPLAFVALKSHATYEKPCGDTLRSLPKRLVAYCPQTLRPALTERRDGLQPWIDNACEDCLKALPVTQSGGPTDWNLFSGHWGERICILGGAFCTTVEPPRSPAQHDRYTKPGGTSNGSD
jgi:hypothetical protein